MQCLPIKPYLYQHSENHWPRQCLLLLFSHSVMSDSLRPDHSTPGFPALHHLLQLAQTHVHWVIDAIQQFHPLSSPSPPAFHLSQHQGLFQWVSYSYLVAKYWSFSISPSNEYSGLVSFRIDWFDILESSRDSRKSSPTPQFKCISSLAPSLL